MPPISFTNREILETIRMVQAQSLDIRTITMGISLRGCSGTDARSLGGRIYERITRRAEKLVAVGEELAARYGIPIINKRVSVTPLAIVADGCSPDEFIHLAGRLEAAAEAVGVNFIGGFSALVEKGSTFGDAHLMAAIPQALAATEKVCASVNVASTKAGINMDAVAAMGRVIHDTARLTAGEDGRGATRIVVFCNAPEDNPFMAGSFHGVGEPECVINVGVSGPGVIHSVVRDHPDADFGTLAAVIKNTAFKITRAGELIAREAARELDVPFGIVDLSLAPTPAVGDSVARVLEAMGLERVGAPGSTAALALLNDAVKKGGAMASGYVGGLSGAFIPVSEDTAMAEAAGAGAISLEKLEAMTCVCSVGLDMIAVPGDTSPATLAALIADEAAIGMINNKTTAVRVIPVPGKGVGDQVNFGGLLGGAPVMRVSPLDVEAFIKRGGRIPAPLRALTN